jgi:hypothetical protein
MVDRRMLRRIGHSIEALATQRLAKPTRCVWRNDGETDEDAIARFRAEKSRRGPLVVARDWVAVRGFSRRPSLEVLPEIEHRGVDAEDLKLGVVEDLQQFERDYPALAVAFATPLRSPTPVTPHNALFPTYKKARVHHAAWRCGGGVAARGARTAAGNAGDRSAA